MSKRLGRSARTIGRTKALGAKVLGVARNDTGRARVCRWMDTVVRNDRLLSHLDRKLESLLRQVDDPNDAAKARELVATLQFAVSVEITTFATIRKVGAVSDPADVLSTVDERYLVAMRRVSQRALDLPLKRFCGAMGIPYKNPNPAARTRSVRRRRRG